MSLDESGGGEPTEEEYLKFFTYLCEVKQVKATTLYSKFAMLNNGHQIRYGKNLRAHAPKLLQLMKNYEYGAVRQA